MQFFSLILHVYFSVLFFPQKVMEDPTLAQFLPRENCTTVAKQCVNYCCLDKSSAIRRQVCCNQCSDSIYPKTRNSAECDPRKASSLLFWAPIIVFFVFLLTGILVGGLLFMCSNMQARKKKYKEIPTQRYSKAVGLHKSSLSDIMQTLELQDSTDYQAQLSTGWKRMSRGLQIGSRRNYI